VVIFSFSGLAAAPAIFIFHSLKGNPFRPEKSSPATLDLLPVGENLRKIFA